MNYEPKDYLTEEEKILYDLKPYPDEDVIF
jgi:hypothetical protein